MVAARRWTIVVALLCAGVILSACATAPLVAPETPRQRYYMAEAGYSAVLDATATLRASGAISAKEYKQVLAPAFDAVEVALDVAWETIKAGDKDARDDALVAVHSALLKAKQLLNRYGGVQ